MIKSTKTLRLELARRALYFLYIITFPLNLKYQILIYVGAILATILEKKSLGEGSGYAKYFLEDEIMNICLIILLLFAGTLFKGLLYTCLLLWAFL